MQFISHVSIYVRPIFSYLFHYVNFYGSLSSWSYVDFIIWQKYANKYIGMILHARSVQLLGYILPDLRNVVLEEYSFT